MILQFSVFMFFSLARLQELITEQTDIHASKQYLVYDNCPLTKLVLPMQAVNTYPDTATDKPLFVFSISDEPFMELQALEIRKLDMEENLNNRHMFGEILGRVFSYLDMVGRFYSDDPRF